MSMRPNCANIFMGIARSKCKECERRQSLARVKPVTCLKCGERVDKPTCLYTRTHYACATKNVNVFSPIQYRIGNSELADGCAVSR